MQINVRNALQEAISLYRITLFEPHSPMDTLIGISLVVLFPVVVFLSLASNCVVPEKGPHELSLYSRTIR